MSGVSTSNNPGKGIIAVSGGNSGLVFPLCVRLDVGFVLETCHNAPRKGKPKIMNSDQGSYFTSPKYIQIFQNTGSRISMDHRGRAYDNIFIERLWRTIKYEDVYPQEYYSPKDARIGINKYIILL